MLRLSVKQLGVIALSIMCMCGVSLPVSAQEYSDVPAEYKITPERRLELYEQARLEPGDAIKRSLMFPGLGNIYADRVFKGMLFMSGAGMGLALGLGGVVRKDTTFVVIGGGAFASIYTAAAITSYYDALAYNDALRLRYKVNLQLVPVVRPGMTGAMVSLEW